MEITLTFERPDEGPGAGPIRVGWFLASDRNAVLYDPPERVTTHPPNRSHAKSAGRCPGVIQLESRYFAVKCPFDLHLGFSRDGKGRPVIVNRAGAASPIRTAQLNELLTVVNEAEWRFPDRPTIQLSTPYCFVADETVYISQLSPFMHYRPDPLPGTIFGGRFPISIWPRPLMWAFEWHDTAKDIVLRRGEPLFYCQFEGMDPARPLQLVEAERTPELANYLEQIGGAVNHVSQTFGLFRAAERLRPKALLVPKVHE